MESGGRWAGIIACAGAVIGCSTETADFRIASLAPNPVTAGSGDAVIIETLPHVPFAADLNFSESAPSALRLDAEVRLSNDGTESDWLEPAWRSETELELVVPVELPPGVYDVQVRGSFGQLRAPTELVVEPRDGRFALDLDLRDGRPGECLVLSVELRDAVGASTRLDRDVTVTLTAEGLPLAASTDCRSGSERLDLTIRAGENGAQFSLDADRVGTYAVVAEAEGIRDEGVVTISGDLAIAVRPAAVQGACIAARVSRGDVDAALGLQFFASSDEGMNRLTMYADRDCDEVDIPFFAVGEAEQPTWFRVPASGLITISVEAGNGLSAEDRLLARSPEVELGVVPIVARDLPMLVDVSRRFANQTGCRLVVADADGTGPLPEAGPSIDDLDQVVVTPRALGPHQRVYCVDDGAVVGVSDLLEVAECRTAIDAPATLRLDAYAGRPGLVNQARVVENGVAVSSVRWNFDRSEDATEKVTWDIASRGPATTVETFVTLRPGITTPSALVRDVQGCPTYLEELLVVAASDADLVEPTSASALDAALSDPTTPVGAARVIHLRQDLVGPLLRLPPATGRVVSRPVVIVSSPEAPVKVELQSAAADGIAIQFDDDVLMFGVALGGRGTVKALASDTVWFRDGVLQDQARLRLESDQGLVGPGFEVRSAGPGALTMVGGVVFESVVAPPGPSTAYLQSSETLAVIRSRFAGAGGAWFGPLDANEGATIELAFNAFDGIPTRWVADWSMARVELGLVGNVLSSVVDTPGEVIGSGSDLAAEDNLLAQGANDAWCAVPGFSCVNALGSACSRVDAVEADAASDLDVTGPHDDVAFFGLARDAGPTEFPVRCDR
jgi:hypothetical protein